MFKNKEMKERKSKVERHICQVCGDKMTWVGVNPLKEHLRQYRCCGCNDTQSCTDYVVDMEKYTQTIIRGYKQ